MPQKQKDTAGELLPVEQLPAKPELSPGSVKELSGKVMEGVFAAAASDSGAAQDLRVVAVGPLGRGGDTLAALAEGSLLMWKVGSDKPRSIDVPSSCVDIAGSGKGVALSCGSRLVEFDAEGNSSRELSVDGEIATGTFTDEGLAALAKVGEDRTFFYDAAGKKLSSDIVSKTIDRSLLVQPKGGLQRIAQIDRTRTSINDVSPEEGAYNASLRIGQGVGQVAAGHGDDGVIVASDNKQNQFLLYTMNDVIRLHQDGPTGRSPYAVAWDSDRGVAWISTTSDNKLTGYEVRTGVPAQVASVDTLANVAGVFVQTNGDIAVVGGNGSIQVISASELDGQVQANASKAAKEFPVKKEGK